MSSWSLLLVLLGNFFYFLNATPVMIPTVEDYFPDLRGNLTAIEWLHAVNDEARLKSGLLNDTVHMLEADVVYGFLQDGTGPMPVMAHPPNNVSDLSLQSFISAVLEAQSSTKKGIKLDFKSNEAYNASWEVLDPFKEQWKFPVWLNADVFRGPVDPPTVPLNPTNFMKRACENLPDALVSVGWTTQFKEGRTYTTAMLEELVTLVKERNAMSPITVPVRAAFAALASDGLIKLVNDIDSFQEKNQTTLTIWMSDPKDVVDVPKLRQLMADLGKRKVALDVPEDLRNQLIGS